MTEAGKNSAERGTPDCRPRSPLLDLPAPESASSKGFDAGVASFN